MNPLDLLKDPDVTDVLVNSVTPIQIECGNGLKETEFRFESEEELQQFAKEIIHSQNARIDISKPFAEVSLQTEHGLLRVHCILGGECSVGTQVSIRRHVANSLTLEELLKSNFLTVEQIILLQEIIANRRNFVIAGATGSGKTTLLRAMLMEIHGERVITIEDSKELNLDNSVSLYTRANNHEGFGEITLGQLVREALRIRPDRLVIGEARGAELAVLLQAMNTGHTGTGFTIHANSSNEVLARMLTMLAFANIQPGLARMMIGSSIEFVIFLIKQPRRQVLSIQKLV